MARRQIAELAKCEVVGPTVVWAIAVTNVNLNASP